MWPTQNEHTDFSSLGQPRFKHVAYVWHMLMSSASFPKAEDSCAPQGGMLEAILALSLERDHQSLAAYWSLSHQL